MKILLTGGTGYIGAHTAVEALNKGYEVVLVDNLSNSKKSVVNAIEQITNKKVKFYQKDLCNKKDTFKIIAKEKPDQVIHFAGLKAVGESVKIPLKYYENNLVSTLNVLEAMQSVGCNNFIFSSSATVYGEPKKLPITEEFLVSATNPYGRTKLFIEEILRDYAKANPNLNICILRYFNPVGAHPSALIGEDPNGIPNNLMPYITKVAMKKLPELKIFGNDYPTKDGTGVRDYIHVVDLARAHICAIDKNLENTGVTVYNVGTGVGYSVLEMVQTFEKVNNILVPYSFVARRAGDIPECYASNAKAEKELRFKTQLSLEDMVKSAYEYEKKHN